MLVSRTALSSTVKPVKLRPRPMDRQRSREWLAQISWIGACLTCIARWLIITATICTATAFKIIFRQSCILQIEHLVAVPFVWINLIPFLGLILPWIGLIPTSLLLRFNQSCWNSWSSLLHQKHYLMCSGTESTATDERTEAEFTFFVAASTQRQLAGDVHRWTPAGKLRTW